MDEVGDAQGFQVGAATETTESIRVSSSRPLPSRLRAKRSAAGVIRATQRGASQKAQRKPLVIPP